MNLSVLLTATEQGLIYSLVALGLYLSFRILNIADEIVLIANGSVKQIGSKEEIMPQLMEVAGVCDFYKK